jgi:hypothetical protein
MVIVIATAIALIVTSLTVYTATSLRFSRIAEDRSDRLSAADAGLRYAVDQLKLRNAGCVLDTQEAVLPGVQADFNGASASVTCERITSGFEGIQAYAAVMTGEGLSPSDSLLSSQSGSNDKILGGPVYMSRVDSSAFSLGPPVEIADGPLLYHDASGSVPCTSVKSTTMPNQLKFEPELIFGPVCVSVPWHEIFATPEVPDLTAVVERDGTLDVGSSPPLPAPQGSFTDISSGGGCRVFEPGHYITAPDLNGIDAYFKTGDYLFDFDDVIDVKSGAVTAGRINPYTSSTNELNMTAACENAQAADPAPVDQFGATFYLADRARINVKTQGQIEIHARQQGIADYVSVQTLCTPNGVWCGPDGDGGFTPGKASTLTAPAPSTDDNLIFTDSGNNKEFVAHALVYAPLAQVEFGNVSNSATQKMLGGLIVSRLVLQSATSATNFEISVPTSPITARIQLTSTAVKRGETSVQAVVEYRPYEEDIEGRVRVNSWRVCQQPDCTDVAAPAPCPPVPATWSAEFFSGVSLSGPAVYTETTSSISYNWGSGSPDPAVPTDMFSARWTRSVNLPSPGIYRFTVGTDDGQRFSVDGVLVLVDWEDQTLTQGTNTVDVTIADECGVDLQLEYYENAGQAGAQLSWVKL